MADNILSPIRGDFGQEQEEWLTPEQLHLLLGGIIDTPLPVHAESKQTLVAYLQYVGVKSQEDLSLLGETDLPRSTRAENEDGTAPYDFGSAESRRIGAFGSLMFKKRLLQLVKYVRDGNRLRIGCTMRDVDMTIRATTASPMPMRMSPPFAQKPLHEPRV